MTAAAYRISHLVEIVREYRADSLEDALEKARQFAEGRKVSALLRSAKDVCVMEPREEEF